MGFMLKIVAPDREFFSGEVDRVIVRGIEGDLAVLKNRAPIVTPLAIGKIRILEGDKERIAAVTNGYLSVTKEETTIITDAAEWPEEIDVERAKEAKLRAEKRLKEMPEGLDIARAELALKRALNRLEVANLKKFDDGKFK
ncbi:ATP synthase F1 subcomplex epsilon subunit [Keratinibaculum paraultunense]|uniref:ATP synthase epsilon chain n=1 Tax=Keratinibaculum paraultunense TaxID=1278232 RepID=A0A4R3KVZ5_9FIRM|nr:ATP synthase F1 subunit epsilon [Keratinibaculum paraultunense]QQY79175.1 ATP synthase F1 subunit epsilon [Keratinibaculum paraultunense]TCS88559.1 ATP synthase F1 subcomplex epsilon subunit [Keratinibaculum paraultunense]